MRLPLVASGRGVRLQSDDIEGRHQHTVPHDVCSYAARYVPHTVHSPVHQHHVWRVPELPRRNAQGPPQVAAARQRRVAAPPAVVRPGVDPRQVRVECGARVG